MRIWIQRSDDLLTAMKELDKKLSYMHRLLQKAQGTGSDLDSAIECNYALELEKRHVLKLTMEYRDTMQEIERLKAPVLFLKKNLTYNPSNKAIMDMQMQLKVIDSVLNQFI